MSLFKINTIDKYNEYKRYLKMTTIILLKIYTNNYIFIKKLINLIHKTVNEF